MNFIPDAGQIAQVISQSVGPAFVLGAVAAFIAVLLNRMQMILDRIRSLNEIADNDTARSHLKSDIPRLQHRAKLLNSSTYLALLSAMCASLLLVVGFASAFLRLKHEYGAGFLFSAVLVLLGCSLFKFSKEVRMGLSEADHFR